MSIYEQAMKAVQNLNPDITFGASALTRVQEEAISTVAAVANRCRYWTMSHGGFLRQHSDDTELANHIMHDYNKADLDDQTRGMLDFAVSLTRDSSANCKADIERLRSLGLSEQQILSTVLITYNFNLMTRLTDGLGLGLEVAETRFEDAKR